MKFEELGWKLHGLHYAGMAWGDPDKPPVLALHGWLDNAASFQRVAETLAETCYVVAPDLSGHGKSDWRSPDATYHIYDDLPQLNALVAAMGWETFSLIGHSRGAAISAMYAATFPEQVGALVLLDGAIPMPLDETEFAAQMRRFIDEKKRLQDRKLRVYPDRAAAVTAREEQGLERAAAELIASRNLYACEGGYRWQTDPRLRGASAIKLTWNHLEAVLGALSMPALLLVAEQGMIGKNQHHLDKVAQIIPDVTLETFPGSHHFHMEAAAPDLSRRINTFISRESSQHV
ncbi:alpha/beta hydrolase [Halioglobus maricola]|uniref:Alpha/beta hydrolase n=1 Tax=Halioglobus maricola TaxID=2601894 RepID=A0A5P9NJY7_9GAMM|nr:alpha/beta hydrolase [Halioglobus maricola]QFU76052.1 alpha/beta hydrolase [Halioglobus maricola]